jgi:gamma-glutamyltranspeptidase / glutathione hydrolase
MIRTVLALLALFAAQPLLAKGGVVSSADPRASAAGQEILRDGGNAVDAAMAMMLALTVVEPQSSGIGGGGFLQVHDPRSGQLASIDGRERAPASARPDMFIGPDGKPLGFREAFVGGRSVGVPGNIRLMERAHRRWGKLPWSRLFRPAIRLAEDGFTVSAPTANWLTRLAPIWADFPDTRAIYWENGAPKKEGATVRNPALAATLRRIAARGANDFYRGQTAAMIARAVTNAPRAPTPMTMRDLSSYRAVDRAPVCRAYRGYRVCGMGPPSSGATTVLQMLGMLERFDLKALGPDSATAWHLIAEAMQLAYADREKYLGDPDFVDVPVAGLLDPTYVASRSALISPTTSLAKYEAGTPPGAPRRTAGLSSEAAGTTHFVAVDGSGLIANMTSTIEGPFGSQLTAGGMALNNELTDFTFTPMKDGAPVANAVAPGKRPLSSMSPTIVYDASGTPVFAVGSAGGKRIIMHVLKALVGKLDWGLSAQQALALPNIYFGGDAVLIERETRLSAIQRDLAALGRTVVVSDLPSKLNAIERLPDGSWRGAADPRSVGESLSE